MSARLATSIWTANGSLTLSISPARGRMLHVGGSYEPQDGDHQVRIGMNQPVPVDTRACVVSHLGDVVFRGAIWGDDLDSDKYPTGQVLMPRPYVGRESCGVHHGNVR